MLRNLSIGIAAAVLATSSSASNQIPKGLVTPTSVVDGVSQGQWSVRWWQWAASIDIDVSPVADRTGDFCASKQRGPVWFLAGVYGSAPVKRSCTVPRGTYLFFPIVNYMIQSLPNKPLSCSEMTRLAKQLTDGATKLTLIIDEVEFNGLAAFRQVSSGCFNLLERVGESRDAAANGYFAMLKPLGPGRHTIKWGGVLDSVRQAVVYEITVR